MGGSFSCVEEVPSLQRLEYDLSPIKNKSAPILWLTGPPGSGKTIQGELLNDNLGFVNLKVGDLIYEESTKDTDRGKIIKDALRTSHKRIPDTIVIDLIKEGMLNNCDESKGYVINHFPKNHKQAEMFIKEIGDVDIILFLHADVRSLVERVKERLSEQQVSEDFLKRKIMLSNKLVKDSVSKFGGKLEKINTKGTARDVFSKIEAAINVRVNMKEATNITTESDYAQPQTVEV